jgi:SAM-dependent methyltransferase
MGKFFVSKQLMHNYEKVYVGGRLSKWRSISAKSKAENIISLCRFFPHRSIIDIGAGDGAVLRRLGTKGFGDKYCAAEISISGIQAILKSEIPKLMIMLFNGYDLPCKDKKFDLAILSHVVEHLEYPRKLLYEAGRIAKYVYIEVPLEDTLRLSKNYKFDEVGHINFYNQKTIRKLVQTCNMDVLQQIVTNYSKESHKLLFGSQAYLKYFIRQVLIQITPWVATKIFTYYSALICTMNSSVTGNGDSLR